MNPRDRGASPVLLPSFLPPVWCGVVCVEGMSAPRDFGAADDRVGPTGYDHARGACAPKPPNRAEVTKKDRVFLLCCKRVEKVRLHVVWTWTSLANTKSSLRLLKRLEQLWFRFHAI
jgi:hypothetical protein